LGLGLAVVCQSFIHENPSKNFSDGAITLNRRGVNRATAQMNSALLIQLAEKFSLSVEMKMLDRELEQSGFFKQLWKN
jgi:hypothetical protein